MLFLFEAVVDWCFPLAFGIEYEFDVCGFHVVKPASLAQIVNDFVGAAERHDSLVFPALIQIALQLVQIMGSFLILLAGGDGLFVSEQSEELAGYVCIFKVGFK